MTAVWPCYQHPRGVWLASCSDCTAWYLPIARGRRDDAAAASPVVVPLRPTTPSRARGDRNAA
jgi:hypothetical protein